jgi:hypothetical protein
MGLEVMGQGEMTTAGAQTVFCEKRQDAVGYRQGSDFVTHKEEEL